VVSVILKKNTFNQQGFVKLIKSDSKTVSTKILNGTVFFYIDNIKKSFFSNKSAY